jgi:hypothetical protein
MNLSVDSGALIISRRHFLKHTSIGVAALGASALVARAQNGANDRINVGLIGVGSRGSNLMGQIIDLAREHNRSMTR